MRKQYKDEPDTVYRTYVLSKMKDNSNTKKEHVAAQKEHERPYWEGKKE